MTPAQNHRIRRVAAVLASLHKKAEHQPDWSDIVKHFAHAVWVNAYMNAIDEATGEGNGGEVSDSAEVVLESAPWGAGSHIEDYAPNMPSEFIAATEKDIVDAWGKDAVLADCAAFMAESGEDEEKYGWYLAMQDMGQGVGLGDYGYTSTLKRYGSHAEHTTGFLTKDGDKILFQVDGTPYRSVGPVDVTSDLEDLVVPQD